MKIHVEPTVYVKVVCNKFQELVVFVIIRYGLEVAL
jgi:hypothetical protein